MLLNWKDVWYEHSINGLLSKNELVAVNIISKLKDKTTRCFSITSNYIWCCAQYCSLDIGGVSFKAAVPHSFKDSQLFLQTSFQVYDHKSCRCTTLSFQVFKFSIVQYIYIYIYFFFFFFFVIPLNIFF